MPGTLGLLRRGLIRQSQDRTAQHLLGNLGIDRVRDIDEPVQMNERKRRGLLLDRSLRQGIAKAAQKSAAGALWLLDRIRTGRVLCRTRRARRANDANRAIGSLRRCAHLVGDAEARKREVEGGALCDRTAHRSPDALGHRLRKDQLETLADRILGRPKNGDAAAAEGRQKTALPVY